MAESYSISARLSAVDSGFSSTLRSASSVVDKLGSKLSGFTFGILSGMGQQFFSMVTSGIGDMVGEINNASVAWKTFEGNMGILGKSESEIESVKDTLQDFATQTIYSASDMASTYSQLASVGIDSADELVKGFGGLAAAAENPTQAMKTLSQQAVQMAAKPTVAWQDFKLMLEQSPAGMAAVAKEMGMTTTELVSAIQDGEVATNAFFDAIKSVAGTGTEFEAMATEYKSVGQAMDGLKETVSNKLLPSFELLSDIGIDAISGLVDTLGNIDGNAIRDAVAGWIEDAKPMWESFKNAASKVWEVVSGVGQKLAPIFASMKNAAGGAVKGLLDKIGQIDASAIVEKVGSALEKMKPYWEAVKSVISSIAGVVAKVMPYVQRVAAAIGNFFLNNSESISKFIPYIVGAIGAFKGFNIVKGLFGKASSAVTNGASAVGSGVSKIAQIINSLGDLFKSVGSGISYAATGIGTAIKSVFVGIGQALKMANPVNIIALGAAFLIASAGIALMATQSEGIVEILTGIGSVVESVGTAIGNILAAAITAVANALVILAPYMPIIAASLVMLTPLVQAFGAAFSMVALAIGEAVSGIVLAISEGISLIVQALTPVVEIIATLITDIVSIFVDGVVRLTEAIAPVLPAFTEAFTAITEIVSNAIVSIIETLAPYIPSITEMVQATSEAIQSICDAFTTLVEQIVPIVESVTELISQLGTSLTEVLGGVSELVTSFGDTVSNIITSIGDAISGVIDSVAGVFDSIGEAALNAGIGFEHLAAGVETITNLNLIDMAASFTAVALALGDLVLKSNGLSEAGAGMAKMATGLLLVTYCGPSAAMALTTVGSAITQFASVSGRGKEALSSMGKSFTAFGIGAGVAGKAAAALAMGLSAATNAIGIAANSTGNLADGAKIAGNALEGLQKASAGIGKELGNLGNVAKAALSIVSNAFEDAAEAAEVSGKQMGTGFAKSLSVGLVAAPVMAKSSMAAVTAAFRAGHASVYAAGAFISQGFARGMLSQLSVIRSAAAQIAAAADAAIRAKAKIHSPSKVSTKLGRFWGGGYAGGIADMAKEAWREAENLVAIPALAMGNMSMAYAGELSEDYEYNRRAEYTIVVPLNVDGKEVAKTTAKYTQEELDKRQTRESRKQGRV